MPARCHAPSRGRLLVRVYAPAVLALPPVDAVSAAQAEGRLAPTTPADAHVARMYEIARPCC